MTDKPLSREEILHDLPKEVIDTINKLGIICDECDEHGNMESYYYLPMWFKKVNGNIFECPFEELPDSVKRVHLQYINKPSSSEYAEQTAIDFDMWKFDKGWRVVWIDGKFCYRLKHEFKSPQDLYKLYTDSKTEK